MRRILLVIDDFNELVELETLFRRLGFDVLSIGRESHVEEALLGFPPDLVVATGRGRHVDGLRLAPKLHYGGTQHPKLVVLLKNAKDAEVAEADRDLPYADVDAVIETPFEPRDALKVVAHLLGLAPDPLLEKYAKIVSARLFEPEQVRIIKHQVRPTPLIHVTSHEEAARPPKPPPKPVLSVREARYAKFLDDKAEEELPPMANGDVMRESKKKLELSEAGASIEEAQRAAILAREKREFVRAMLEARNPDEVTEIERKLPLKPGGSKS